jgi:hypothetical protein
MSVVAVATVAATVAGAGAGGVMSVVAVATVAATVAGAGAAAGAVAVGPTVGHRAD